uniref:F-box domain-containing protein n=1 Tax=Strongyloides papillosus TaxID=174720 RepID=A0A0N5BQE6_STREA
MDLISLPKELKLQILKKLYWKDLKNLKLVCKDLYFTVVDNIEKLDRPNRPDVGYLKIYYSENKILGVDYKSRHSRINLRDRVVLHTEFSDEYECEIFIKHKDFTKIEKLIFEDVTNSAVITVEDTYTTNGYRIDVSLSDRTSEPLKITISSCNRLRIPYNGNIFRKESLRKMGLFERDGHRLVIKKIIMDIITGGPMLEYGNTSTDTNRPISIQITYQLCELGLFNLENRCKNEMLSFCIYWSGESEVLEEEFYRELYDKIKFNDSSVKDIDFQSYPSFISTKCSKCGNSHGNFIFFNESRKCLNIDLY